MTTTATNELTEKPRSGLTLRQRATEAVLEAEFKREEQELIKQQERAASRIKFIADWMLKQFGLGADELAITDDGWSGESAVATVEGLRFQVREMYEESQLCVEQPCKKCGQGTWVELGRWKNSDPVVDLGYALETEHSHRWNCMATPTEGIPEPSVETVEQRLADVLREIVRDELANLGVGA